MDIVILGRREAPQHILLAHGAGAGSQSPFMTRIAELLVERDFCVNRFDFAYMAARAVTGKRRPPPRAELLQQEYEAAVALASTSMPGGARLLIGGKSMGGRVASLVADRLHSERRIAGLVCIGYPFHPTGRPEQLRTAHLENLACPSLIVQGDRDPFGSRSEVAGYALSPAIAVHWVADGDHDLGPRGASGYTRKGNLADAADAIAGFAHGLNTDQ